MSKNELINQDLTGVSKMNAEEFELAQRKAMVYAKSTLVPKQYQNNVSNCLIAMHMAKEIGADILMVMQNLYIVHQQPAWSAKFMIACFNACGKYSAIRYNMNDEKTECYAYAIELRTGEVLTGTTVSLAMAKADGWSTKNGSKWKTMPELMLRYRAASMFIKTTAPDILMGMQFVDEVSAMKVVEATVVPKTVNLNDMMAAITDDVGDDIPPETLAESIDSMDAEAKGGDLFASEGSYE